MSKSKNLSDAEVKRIVEDSADAAKPAAAMPSWGDIKDGFKTIVKENVDGTCEASVPLDPSTDQGRKAIGLLQEMYRPSWRAEGERSQNVRGRTPKETVRVGNEKRRVNARVAEMVERRRHAPRASIVVPEMPWKREKGGA